jgi:hypothetical protein
MTKAKQDLNRTVYFINQDGEIESDNYRVFVSSFAETTTTPMGVGKKFHLRDLELWTWGVAGNNPRLVLTSETQEEADSALFETFEQDRDSHSDRDTRCWDTEAEAKAALAEILGGAI